jgi:hypothetical protein
MIIPPVCFSQINNSVGNAPFSNMIIKEFSQDNILNANNRCFVYGSATSNHQLYKHFLGNINLTPIGTPITSPGLIGAMARNTTTGVLYINNQASPFNIWTVDTNTGVCTQVLAGCYTIPLEKFTGMVWDHTTGTMFGLSSDNNSSQIFTINMTSGICTPIGTPSTVCAGGNGIYCSPCGSLFVSEIIGNNLHKVNKTTGVFTLIGALGFDANYDQDGAFDLSEGILYLCSAGPGNNLRVCDTLTGNATLIIGTYSVPASCIAIVASQGPGINHTPLPNTQNLTGPYAVNAVVASAGSTISSTKLYWSRNNAVVTDSVIMTNSGGNNWTGNIPGNGSTATYRYYIKALDALGRAGYHPLGAPGNLNSFQAILTDTIKPAITHTPIGNTPKSIWPVVVNSSVTDNIGVDSVWVRWYKNSPSNGYKQFRLNNSGGSNYSALFNSINSEVNIDDYIIYRIIAQDNSTNHNRDSTQVYSFMITIPYNICIGTGTSPSNYPFTTYWMDGQTLMLFTASELLAGGMTTNFAIKGIGFNVISASPQVMNGFYVGIQHTSLTSLTGWVTSGWTTMYSGTYAVPNTGWQYINFQAPNFYYNGTSNLLVLVCYDNSSYTTYSTVNATNAPGMTWGYYTDNSTGCVMTAGTSQPIRPNICFTSIIDETKNNSNIIPEHYSLSQNYPNPFNPVTKINFAIPKQGLVNLKVYDVLGREIKTIINEIKNPGMYSVDFNGSDLSSGIYFYRLESNGFTEIRKMIIIK